MAAIVHTPLFKCDACPRGEVARYPFGGARLFPSGPGAEREPLADIELFLRRTKQFKNNGTISHLAFRQRRLRLN